MTYLRDVNALVALGFLQHLFNDRVASWVRKLASKGPGELATCSITELAFVRILAPAQYGISVRQASDLRARLKLASALELTFNPDNQVLSALPGWLKSSRRTTDGHLVQPARAHGIALPVLDRSIPRSSLIP